RSPSMAALGEALLAPGGYVTPFAARADEDAFDVVRAARPMSRAEIMRNRAPQAPSPAEPPPAEPPPRSPASRRSRHAGSVVVGMVRTRLALLAGGAARGGHVRA